jgi:rRNA maturation endonuclease Nob1
MRHRPYIDCPRWLGHRWAKARNGMKFCSMCGALVKDTKPKRCKKKFCAMCGAEPNPKQFVRLDDDDTNQTSEQK